MISNNYYRQKPRMDTKISVKKVEDKQDMCLLSNYLPQATY